MTNSLKNLLQELTANRHCTFRDFQKWCDYVGLDLENPEPIIVTWKKVEGNPLVVETAELVLPQGGMIEIFFSDEHISRSLIYAKVPDTWDVEGFQF